MNTHCMDHLSAAVGSLHEPFAFVIFCVLCVVYHCDLLECLRVGPLCVTVICLRVAPGCRISPLRFLAGCRKRHLNQAFSFVYLYSYIVPVCIFSNQIKSNVDF